MLYTWNLHTIVNQLQLKKFFLSIWKGNVENVGFSGGGYCRNKGHQHGVCQELMRCCQQSPAAIPHAGRVSMNYLSFWFMTQNICSEILIICYVGKTSPGRSGSPGQTLVTWWVLGVLSGVCRARQCWCQLQRKLIKQTSSPNRSRHPQKDSGWGWRILMQDVAKQDEVR